MSKPDDSEFATVRMVRPGYVVHIGASRVEVIEGRAKLRVVTADGQHVRFAHQRNNELSLDGESRRGD